MIIVDSPDDPPRLAAPYDMIAGWFSGQKDGASLRLGGIHQAFSPVDRPDLQGRGTGFLLYVDLPALIGSPVEDAERLVLSVKGDCTVSGEAEILVGSEVWAAARRASEGKAKKREWLARTIRHPVTFEAAAFENDDIVFERAGTRFPQSDHRALNLLDPAFAFTGRLSEKTDGVSAHPYPVPLQREIERLTETGGMALDFGAGLKKTDHQSIVCMEIFDYPSTDILCVGQKLPFPDACFDMVMTLAVLEHVDDPFACAGEIMRVLKPGGRLFSGVPFLQPEHGYPDHYFNMTRSGHRRIYGPSLEIERHMVDDHQHPFLALQWMLRAYADGLPPHARGDFTGLTVESLLTMRYWRERANPVVEALSEDAQWQLASATTLIGRKRS